MPLPLAALAAPLIKGIVMDIAKDLLGDLTKDLLGNLGDKLKTALPEVMEDLATPNSPIGKIVDAVLEKMGIPAPFRAAAAAVADPMGAIRDVLDGPDMPRHRPVADGTTPTSSGEFPPAGGTAPNGSLSVTDNGVIDTGRYLISASEDHGGELIIKDKETGETIRAWGDPHVETSDGDFMKFHQESLTIELPDGTKVTLKPTELTGGKGAEWIDSVAITKGDEAVVLTGFHDGVRGNLRNDGIKTGWEAAAIDNEFEDGTVLRAGAQIDDLYHVNANGEATREIRGGSRRNEHDLDQLVGGRAQNNLDIADFANLTEDENDPFTNVAGGDSTVAGSKKGKMPKGLSLAGMLAWLAGQANSELRSKVAELGELQAEKRKLSGELTKAANDGEENAGAQSRMERVEELMPLVQAEVQELTGQRKQLQEMLTNLLKADKQVGDTTVRNFV